MKKARLGYAAGFVFIFFIEVLIALFVHDQFVRPYVGDILVVVVVYLFVRIIIPTGVKGLPLFVFLFAVLVEAFQYFNLVERLGLENTIFRVIIGSVFDVKDIICYGIGCILLLIWEQRLRKIREK